MAGKAKILIDQIIQKRSKGDPTLMLTTKTKIILKGVNPDKYTLQSEDDPTVLDALKKIAVDLGVTL